MSKITEEVISILWDGVSVWNNDEMNSVADKIASLISSKEKLDDWISVEDRFPYDYNETGLGLYVYDGAFVIEGVEYRGGKFMIPILDHDGDVMDYDYHNTVKHWMEMQPFPSPPEAK